MNSIVFYIGLCLALPILMLCFYLERRARRIIVSMIGGVLVGLAAYHLDNRLASLLKLPQPVIELVMAPVVEEILKFIPVAVIGFIVRKGKRGSAANAFSVGVGFSVVENFLYLFSFPDTATVFWIISRCIGTGLMHSMSATILGMGVYFARVRDRYKVLRIVKALLFAMVLHCGFNVLIGDDRFTVIGILLPVALYIIFYLVLKKEDIQNFLWDRPNPHPSARQ